LRRRFGVDQVGELGRDACGGGVDGASEMLFDPGAGVGGESVPSVEDPGAAIEEVLGEVRLDAGDDGRAGLGEAGPGRRVLVGQASSPTRRSASTGSRTSPVTKGPNSA
jgi:hypothetical protein